MPGIDPYVGLIQQGFGSLSQGAQTIGDRRYAEEQENRPLTPSERYFADMLQGRMTPRQAAIRAKLESNPDLLQQLQSSMPTGEPASPQPVPPMGAPGLQGPEPATAAPLGMPQAVPPVNGGLGAGPQQAAPAAPAPEVPGGGTGSVPGGGLGARKPLTHQEMSPEEAQFQGGLTAGTEQAAPPIRTLRELKTALAVAPQLNSTRDTPEDRMARAILASQTSAGNNIRTNNTRLQAVGLNNDADLEQLQLRLKAQESELVGKMDRLKLQIAGALKNTDKKALTNQSLAELKLHLGELNTLRRSMASLSGSMSVAWNNRTALNTLSQLEADATQLEDAIRERTAGGAAPAPKPAGSNSGMVPVRSKKTGVTRMVPAAKAEQYLKDPGYERGQ